MRILFASLCSALVIVAACGGVTAQSSTGPGASGGAGTGTGTGAGGGGGATQTAAMSAGHTVSAGVGGAAPSPCAGGPAPSCNSVALGSTTNQMEATTAPPEMTGGTIVDGTWVMIAKTVYHPADAGTLGGGPPIAEVQQIMGSVLLDVSEINGGGPEGGFATTNYGSLVTDGNHLTAKTTCGCEPDLDVTYTTDGVTLQELTPLDADGFQWLTVFEKM